MYRVLVLVDLLISSPSLQEGTFLCEIAIDGFAYLRIHPMHVPRGRDKNGFASSVDIGVLVPV